MLKDLKIFKILGFCVWLLVGIVSYKLPFKAERVIFFDVGQGDSILVQKDNFEILIDGGANDSVIYKLGKYMQWNDKLVDIVVITHMHDDHYMGIKYLLERYEVGLFLLSPNCGDLCQEFKSYNYIEVSEGMNLDYQNIKMNILWPRVGALDDNLNNDSIVFLLKYLNKRILLMGDAEKEVEEIILEDYGQYITDIDILKAGHHCSKTASSYEFLEITDPKLSICSCGEDNKFGHPHQETINNFNILNIPYYITWEDGDYVVE
jgi:competence protein ComEC